MTAGIRSIRNQYHGINAHLHSYWQSKGGWHSFHGNHIADLLRTLRAALLPMGYTADLETSLQVRRLEQRISEPESDVTIFDFDRYSPADQTRIANRMVAVLQAAQAGIDLESGPFAADALPLAEALAQLELYKSA